MAGNSFLTLSWRWREKEKKGDKLKKIQTATQVSFLPLSSFSLFHRVLHVLRSPWSQVAAVFTWSAVWLSACTLCNRLHRPQAVCARVVPFLNRLIEKEFKQEAKRRKNKLKEKERERELGLCRGLTLLAVYGFLWLMTVWSHRCLSCCGLLGGTCRFYITPLTRTFLRWCVFVGRAPDAFSSVDWEETEESQRQKMANKTSIQLFKYWQRLKSCDDGLKTLVKMMSLTKKFL